MQTIFKISILFLFLNGFLGLVAISYNAVSASPTATHYTSHLTDSIIQIGTELQNTNIPLPQPSTQTNVLLYLISAISSVLIALIHNRATRRAYNKIYTKSLKDRMLKP